MFTTFWTAVPTIYTKGDIFNLSPQGAQISILAWQKLLTFYSKQMSALILSEKYRAWINHDE